MIDRRRLLGAATLLAPALVARPGWTQPWPSRFVRFVCPYAPGGAIDVIARVLAGRLSELWGHQMVVDNRPGAAANIAHELVARTEPDGYTMLITSLALAVNRYLFPSLPYDPIADFAPVTLICLQPNMMVVPNSSPARSVVEFIAFAKSNDARTTFASGGIGTSLHLSGELFKRMAGIEMTHVAYRGAGLALNDLIPGRIDVMFDNVTTSLPQVRAGNLRALAVTPASRVPIVAELPTIAEAGLPGFDVTTWFALFAPVRTPAEIVAKIHDDMVAALAHPPVKRTLEDLGCALVGSTPAALARHLKAEMEKWGPVIRDAGIRIDNN